jgi:hypothetical protein
MLKSVKIIFKQRFYDLDVEDPVKMIMENIEGTESFELWHNASNYQNEFNGLTNG